MAKIRSERLAYTGVLLADAGSGLATQSIPASPGVPEVAAAQTVIAPFNDFSKLWELTDDPDLHLIVDGVRVEP